MNIYLAGFNGRCEIISDYIYLAGGNGKGSIVEDEYLSGWREYMGVGSRGTAASVPRERERVKKKRESRQ